MTEEQNKLAELVALSEKATQGLWNGIPLNSIDDHEFVLALVNWFRANQAALRREPATSVRLALLERAYWIATGLNPAQDLGPDAMSAPLTDEEIIKQAELTASIVQEREPATEAVLDREEKALLVRQSWLDEGRNEGLEEAAKVCHEAALQLRAMADGQRAGSNGRAAADSESKAATAETLERALKGKGALAGVPSVDEVPHFWMGHRDREPSTEEIVRMSDKLVQAVTEDYWKDAIVQWPQRFLHTKECNVHEPKLSLCSCGLETRLKDEILRLLPR